MARIFVSNVILYVLYFFFLGLLRHAFLKGSGYGFATKEKDNESDLLHEIDSALKFGKGFLFGKGAFHYFVRLITACIIHRYRIVASVRKYI